MNNPNNATNARQTPQTAIGQGAEFSGSLRVDGDLLVNGDFEGTIACNGTLSIGVNGKLKAEVECQDAQVAGHMEGKIFAKERVELQSGSHFEGDVHSKSFMIHDGVFFQGNCSMGEAQQKRSPAESADGSKPDLGILKQS